MVKLTYDKEVDAAYIYLKDSIKAGEAKETLELSKNIIIDLDKNKQLIGIEVLDASQMIDDSILKSAKLS